MARTTITFGITLIILGVVGYIGTAAASVTALIPAMFGAVLGLLGWIALNERYRRHAIHMAAAVGVVGLLGSVRGLIGLMDLFTGAEVERPMAVVSQSVMAILMTVFLGLWLKSLLAARRKRDTAVKSNAPSQRWQAGSRCATLALRRGFSAMSAVPGSVGVFDNTPMLLAYSPT
jgi:hypothetical protein